MRTINLLLLNHSLLSIMHRANDAAGYNDECEPYLTAINLIIVSPPRSVIGLSLMKSSMYAVPLFPPDICMRNRVVVGGGWFDCDGNGRVYDGCGSMRSMLASSTWMFRSRHNVNTMSRYASVDEMYSLGIVSVFHSDVSICAGAAIAKADLIEISDVIGLIDFTQETWSAMSFDACKQQISSILIVLFDIIHNKKWWVKISVWWKHFVKHTFVCVPDVGKVTTGDE